MKNLVKSYATAWSSDIIFFWNYFLVTFLGEIFFFFDKRYFRFCYYFISKMTLPSSKTFRYHISLVLILLNKFFFSLLIKLTERLRCLLYAFLSMSLFVFKNLFLSRDFFMISLLSFCLWKALGLLKHTAFYWSMSLNSFITRAA